MKTLAWAYSLRIRIDRWLLLIKVVSVIDDAAIKLLCQTGGSVDLSL